MRAISPLGVCCCPEKAQSTIFPAFWHHHYYYHKQSPGCSQASKSTQHSPQRQDLGFAQRSQRRYIIWQTTLLDAVLSRPYSVAGLCSSKTPLLQGHRNSVNLSSFTDHPAPNDRQSRLDNRDDGRASGEISWHLLVTAISFPSVPLYEEESLETPRYGGRRVKLSVLEVEYAHRTAYGVVLP